MALGDLVVNLRANARQFNRTIGSAGATMSSMASRAASLGKTAAVGVASIGAAAGAAAIGMVKLAGDQESVATAFRTMLGSGEAATHMLKQLNSFAASTPFETDEIYATARSLMSFGTAAGDVQNQLQLVGDVAAGANVPINELAQIFGKAQTKGRVMTEELTQFAERGVPVMQVMADQFGVTTAELLDMASKGKISFSDLEKSMQTMTSEGGIFFQSMQAQSETLNGKWSTLVSNMKMAGAGIGETLMKSFNVKALVDNVNQFAIGFSDTFKQFEPVINQVSMMFSAAWDSMVAVTQTALGGIQSALGLGGISTFQGWVDFIVDSLITIEFAFKNWQDLVKLTWLNALAGLFDFGGAVKHFFVTAIPHYLAYFADNWKSIFTDIFNMGKTVFTNLVKNVGKIFSNLKEIIKGNISVGDLWTPLTTGFVSEVKKMQDVPPRVMGEMEKRIRKDADNLGEQLGAGFAAFQEERMKAIMPAKAEMDKASEEVVLPKAAKKEESRISSDKKQQVRDLSRGSNAAMEVLRNAFQPGMKDKIQEEQLKTQKSIVSELQKLNNQPKDEEVIDFK